MIKVAIAEDQRLVREALAKLLSAEPDLELVGEAGSAREAIDMTLERGPEVLVLDIVLPDGDGIEVTRALRRRAPHTKVLALSVHDQQYFVREMLRAGASGYVDKTSALGELVRAIHQVVEGKLYVSPNLMRETVASHQPDARTPLSRREQQVLVLLAQGKRSPEIAVGLHISAATVEAHRRNIMQKLALHSVADLTRYAVREGLVRL